MPNLLTDTDIAYFRLCAGVYCAGIKIWQERMDQILAALDTPPNRPLSDKVGIPEDD